MSFQVKGQMLGMLTPSFADIAVLKSSKNDWTYACKSSTLSIKKYSSAVKSPQKAIICLASAIASNTLLLSSPPRSKARNAWTVLYCRW